MAGEVNIDKLIFTNCDVLTIKYQAAGLAKVQSAIKRLIAADAKRGIISRLIDLSDAATMGRYGVAPIPAASATDARLNKAAIDAVYTHGMLRASYLLLLGAVDVIPHVPLANPVAGDGDADVPSDLPYACEAAYGTNVQDFRAPTRVVGRLPDITGGNDPKYICKLIDTAADYKPRPSTDYSPYLGISAEVWKTSSELSLDAIFGNHSALKVSPPDGPKWTPTESKRLSHFINCHGAAGDWRFYGQSGGNYPIAHSAKWMSTRLVEGTVLAAECCYGTELYDPATTVTAGGQMGMCNTYLGAQAYAVFGSTNIAYGPTDSNDQADVICQDFLLSIASGASTGRACLTARLKYIMKKGSVLQPTDLKTLAQFNLMGDPSITPVTVAPSPIAIASTTMKKPDAVHKIERHARLERRAALSAAVQVSTISRLLEPKNSSQLKKSALFPQLLLAAAQHGIDDPTSILSFSLETKETRQNRGSLELRKVIAGDGPKAVHAVIQVMDPPAEIPQLKLVRGIQVVQYGNVMEVRPFESR